MIFLKGLRLGFEQGPYPFNSPALAGLEALPFSASVTLLVGENGSGKSTLLEALARKLRLPALGSAELAQDPSLAGVEPLSSQMTTVFAGKRPRTGFFLRAEDFFGYTKRIAALQAEMQAELKRVETEYRGKSRFTQDQARMAFAGSLHSLQADHGPDPDARSHGESFIHLFQGRLREGGLYLLDEPEAPLSPARQLALISLIKGYEPASQFILATHSPILMAYPGAAIWSFDEAPAALTPYDQLESVQLTRDFLACPQRYLRQL